MLAGVQEEAGVTLGDVVAVAAMVLAVLTIFLDIAFFFFEEHNIQHFVETQIQRQDQLTRQQIDTLSKVSEVMAQVSERARIVQEQVDKQMVRLTDFVIAQTSSAVQERGEQVSEVLNATIASISDQVEELRRSQIPQDQLMQMSRQLDELKRSVSSLPVVMSESVRSSAQALPSAMYNVTHANDSKQRSYNDQILLALWNATEGNPSEARTLKSLLPLLSKDAVEWLQSSNWGLASFLLKSMQNIDQVTLHDNDDDNNVPEWGVSLGPRYSYNVTG